jgi:LCP family protein required for cell wall assembly
MKASSVLLLGVDIVYTGGKGRPSADPTSFQGRSDTIMLARLDPARNSFFLLSIPRDTTCEIPGYGRQKINGANALGGERLAMRSVERLTGIHCDHFLVLNVHGLVELVDALGGITINVPKKMRYRDKTAGLNINLPAGSVTLNGTEAVGFVRFRHDALGDIGRVQRQELFIQSLIDKSITPAAWVEVPHLIQIAKRHVKTDLDMNQIMQVLNFVRQVPKANQYMMMLPGNFSGTGDWSVDQYGFNKVLQAIMGKNPAPRPRAQLAIAIENASSYPALGRKLSRYLQKLGYPVISVSSRSDKFASPQAQTRIIAEQGNPQDAALLNSDLHKHAEIVNLSIGDIHSSLTIVAGEDLIPSIEPSFPQRESSLSSLTLNVSALKYAM